jgi:hypothetical protein
MKPNECPNESCLLAALVNDSMTDELTAHLHDCAVCQDTKLVWNYLQQYANADQQTDVAAAESIWWRARLARKRVEARRSIAFIDTMQKIAFAVAAIIAIAIAAWQAPKLFETSRLLLAGAAAVLILLAVSLIVVFTLDHDSHPRALSRGM